MSTKYRNSLHSMSSTLRVLLQFDPEKGLIMHNIYNGKRYRMTLCGTHALCMHTKALHLKGQIHKPF